MTATDQPADAGRARSPGITYQELLDAERAARTSPFTRTW